MVGIAMRKLILLGISVLMIVLVTGCAAGIGTYDSGVSAGVQVGY